MVMAVAFISPGTKKPQAEVRASQHLDAEAYWEMSEIATHTLARERRDLEGHTVWGPWCDIRKSLRLVSEGSITVLLFYPYLEINIECRCEGGEKRSDMDVRGKKNPSQRKDCVSKVGRRVRELQLQLR